MAGAHDDRLVTREVEHADAAAVDRGEGSVATVGRVPPGAADGGVRSVPKGVQFMREMRYGCFVDWSIRRALTGRTSPAW